MTLRVEPVPGFTVAVTSRHSGDFAVDAPGVDARRCAVARGLPVGWLTQVHGTTVEDLDVRHSPDDSPDESRGQGPRADAAVIRRPGFALSVVTADCAPIALWSETGAIAVIHAGWRGLLGGVVERTAAAVRRDRPDAAVHALLGPCIHAECYEFGTGDLDSVASVYGDDVRGTTRTGTAALDLPAAVSEALARAEVTSWNGPGAAAFDACTACDERWYSWRARQDTGRQAMLVWRTA